MSLYRRIDTGEIRELDPARLASLHPNKQAMWEPYVAPPPPPPEPVFIEKDLLIRRIRAAGKMGAMRQLLAQMSPDQQFEFTHLTKLDPTRPDLRQGITQIGLNPDEMLAP